MTQLNSSLISNEENSIRHSFERSQNPLFTKEKKYKNQVLKSTEQKFTNQRIAFDQKKVNKDPELWEQAEIEQLFRLYDCYGSQWKIMSKEIPFRTANNLKNRFYTVLRNLVKLLFRKKKNICPKLPGQIPSKDLCRLYNGQQIYENHKGFLKRLLEYIEYDLQNPQLLDFVTEHEQKIKDIFQLIYGQRTPEARNLVKEAFPKQKQREYSNSQERHFPIISKPVNSLQQIQLASNQSQYPFPVSGLYCIYFIGPEGFYLGGPRF